MHEVDHVTASRGTGRGRYPASGSRDACAASAIARSTASTSRTAPVSAEVAIAA